MLVTTRAIVLKTFRHGDRSVVMKAWTRRHGLRGYVVRIAARGGGMAALQGLGRVELVAAERSDRDLQTVRELRVERPYLRIPTEPLRASVALFVQEVLYRVLKQESADEDLDDFLHAALEALDQAPDLSHFPLVFLLRLSGHLGFLPEAPGPGEDHFDLREGHFMPQPGEPDHTLGPPLSTALAHLLQAQLDEPPPMRIPARQRHDLLDHLLLYYRLHLEGMGEMRSPAVLHQVLG